MRATMATTRTLGVALLALGGAATAQRPDHRTADAGLPLADGGATPLDWKASMVRVPEDQWGVPPLWVDRTEVTVDEYRACVVARKCPVPEPPRDEHLEPQCNWRREERKRHPMNCVTYAEASAYCGAHGKRLPTEREWESAASGAKGTLFPWGAVPPDKQACWNRPAEGTCPVGEVKGSATPQGAVDFAGDVWEWTHTCAKSTKGACEAYVRRGGSYRSQAPIELTTTASAASPPKTRSSDLGFRCAHDDPKN